MANFLISTGDYSADLHGEALVRELRALDPSLSITALGGEKLKSVSDVFLHDLVSLDVSGFTQPFKQFFKLKNILQRDVFPRLDKKTVDAVICIDYYGFNIHVARRAKKNGIPVLYFVSPQVWASRPGRVSSLKKVVQKMLVIFPFEETFYKKHRIPVEFVGHPLMDRVSALPERKYAGRNGKIRLGLMPGSRKRELIQHVPMMARAAARIKEKFGTVECRLLAVDFLTDQDYVKLLRACPEGQSLLENGTLKIIRDNRFESRQDLTLCLTASGTATLENALIGVPMVVVYQMSWLTHFVASRIVKVPYISMPNLLSGREMVPELIQKDSDALAQTAETLLSHPMSLEKMHEDLVELRRSLGGSGAYVRAAKAVFREIRA